MARRLHCPECRRPLTPGVPFCRCGWPERPRRNGIASSLWKGAKAGYHHYRASSLEARARAHRRKAVLNPKRGTGIPGRVLEVRYLRGGKDPGRYVHRFGPNVKMRLGPGRHQVVLYHGRREPIWTDERGRDFDHWVDVDHKRRAMNPRRGGRRRRRASGGGQPDWLMLGLIGFGLFYFSRPAGAVSTGGQMILPQGQNDIWFSDPFQGGGGEFFQGSLPPGSAPPWRLAAATEISAMAEGLAAGSLYAAGGGLIAPNPSFLT